MASGCYIKAFVFLWNLVSTASLGIASHVIVTIEASDDAHGVFEFSAGSLSVNGTEPEDGNGTVQLQVSKSEFTVLMLHLNLLSLEFLFPLLLFKSEPAI